MSRLVVVLSVALLALPALADDVIAIAPIQGELDAARRSQSEGALAEATATFAPVQSAADTAAHIEAGAALEIRCASADVACWRRIRELANVDRLIVPVREGDLLKLFLVTRAASLDRTEEVDFIGELAVGSARRVIARLLDVRAQLTIISNVNGAMVELDGKLVGQAPFRDPIEGLKAGPHKLRVYAANHTEVTRTVDLAPGEDAVIQVDLEAVEVQRGLNGLFWTGAGLIVGGGVVMFGGGIFTLLSIADQPRLSEFEEPAPPTISEFLQRRDQNTTQQVVGISIAAAGAAILTTGAIMILLAEDSE